MSIPPAGDAGVPPFLSGSTRPDVACVLDLAQHRPPTLGASRLVCVDGPAGSGKTTFAALLAEEAQRRGLGVAVVHLDDVYAGWSGLPAAGERIGRLVVDPLAAGRPGRYPRYDWERECWAEERTVPVTDLVLVEGVGSGHLGYARRITVLVWVEVPADLRLRRGLLRDGADLEPLWRTWMAQEQQLLARERTRDRADVCVDGATGELTLGSGPG